MGTQGNELQFGTGGLRAPRGNGAGCMESAAAVLATQGVVEWLDTARAADVVVMDDDVRVGDKDGAQACVMLCDLARRLKGAGVDVQMAPDDTGRRYGDCVDTLRTHPAGGAGAYGPLARGAARARLCGQAVSARRTEAGFCLTGAGIKATLRASGTEPGFKAYLSAQGGNRPEAQARLCEFVDGVARRVEKSIDGRTAHSRSSVAPKATRLTIALPRQGRFSLRVCGFGRGNRRESMRKIWAAGWS